MRIRITFILIFTAVNFAQGQHNAFDTIFIYNRPKDKRIHFKKTPTNIEMAVSQLESDFTEKGRNYFKSLSEPVAMLQFGNIFYMLAFTWKIHKQNETGYSLLDYFKKNGSTEDDNGVIRLSIAALHRKLNNKTYSIGELSSKYGNKGFQSLIDSIRNVHPADTVFGSWFNEERIPGYSYEIWFKVLSKDDRANTLATKIIRLLKKNSDVKQIITATKTWTLGDTTEWTTEDLKNGTLRNWKEEIEILYPKIKN